MANLDLSDLLQMYEKEETSTDKNKLKQQTEKVSQPKQIEEIKIPPVQIHNDKVTGFEVKKFESLLRNQLLSDFRRSLGWKRPYLSVTELLYCPRKVYYSRKQFKINEEDEFKFAYLYLINKVGSEVHRVVQKLYTFDEVEKTVIDEKNKIKGRIDAIKDNTIVEIKTMDADKFTGTYKVDHYHQGVICSHILNTCYNYHINNITIVYVFRDLRTIHTFDVDPSQSLAVNFIQKAETIKKSLLSGKVPEANFNTDSEECTFCSYKNYCKGESSTENNYVDLLI